MGRLNGMVSPLFAGGILDSWHRHCDGISNFVSRPLFEAYDVILVSTLSKLYTRNVFSVWHILYIIIVSQWRHSDTFILFIYCCRWHIFYIIMCSDWKYFELSVVVNECYFHIVMNFHWVILVTIYSPVIMMFWWQC